VSTGRLEAFSDGVVAILITIMVLDLRVPSASDPAALLPLAPVFVSYVLSFVNIGIYWTNHHHLFQAARQVNGRVLWTNINLLFWLSLVPFATAWMGENGFAPVPTALYGVVLLLAGVAYFVLERALIGLEGKSAVLGTAVGGDRKGQVSIVIYALAIPLALVAQWLGLAMYIGVAVLWFVPDRRIERTLTS
jgi:uncharacterized membrane protein